MSLTSGSRLGPFEILSPLGAGGMGQVYKARDTRLDRVVAIKILPDALSNDPGFRERFRREARAISQLDHPNICTLYDVGEQDSTAYLVMQYLEGETLESRLARGPLPVADALALAIQIADALDRAHRAGIVHRDLKPGNIMLTAIGAPRAGVPQAKLVDFGLAKGSVPAGVAPGLSMLPTTPAGLTAEGTILGTFQYMAPEQLEGHEADARTDIFAFGAVLYEMLAGRRAFEASSRAGLIAAILHAEPAPIPDTRGVSPTLGFVLVTCLAKHPDERWQSAADVARQLRGIATGSVGVVETPAVAGHTRRGGSRRVALVTVGALAIAALAVAAAVWTGRDATVVKPVTRFVLALPPNAPVSLSGNFNNATPGDSTLPNETISPDGMQVVYGTYTSGTERRLMTRRLDSLDTLPLAGGQTGAYPVFSADGQTVLFVRQSPLSIARVSSGGGPATPVILPSAGLNTTRGMTSMPDGSVIIANQLGELLQVPSDGGAVKTLLEAPAEWQARWPFAVPDGSGVLFTEWRTLEQSRVAFLSFKTGRVTQVAEGATFAQYAPSGHVVYYSNGSLMAAPFDLGRAAVVGRAVPVLQNVRVNFQGGAADFTVSASGTLLYVEGVGTDTPSPVLVDRQGHEMPLETSGRLFAFPRMAPGGGRLAMLRMPERDAWVLDLQRPGSLSRVPTQPNANFLLWTPDGRRLVFGVREAKGWSIYATAVDGHGEAERLGGAENISAMSPEGWSADGKTVVYSHTTADGGFDIGVLALNTDGVGKSLLKTKANEDALGISPDGRWIAYESDDTGQYEVYVERFPSLGGRQQISVRGGRSPLWSPTGRELFYRRGSDGAVMSVAVGTGADLNPGPPQVVLTGPYVSGNGRGYDVTPDGKQFVLFKANQGATPQLVVVQNWTEELKRLVPFR